MGLFNFFKNEKQEANIQREVIATYTIEFPYRGAVENEGIEEYITGKTVYSYLNQETIDGINSSWNNSDMVSFINIKDKINDMELSIKENGVCNICVKAYEELTNEDREYLLNFVKGQASDGWGEGNFDYIYNKNNKDVYFYWDSPEKANDNNCIPFSIKFWWYDTDWYIKYVEGE